MTNNFSTDFDMTGRLSKLVEKVETADCEALLVTSITNIYYLSGFTGSAGLLWIDADTAEQDYTPKHRRGSRGPRARRGPPRSRGRAPGSRAARGARPGSWGARARRPAG